MKDISEFLQSKGFSTNTDVAIILGSGLGGFTSQVSNAISVPYTEIPGFPPVTVAGHGGDLIQGKIGSKNVIVFSGRFHFYEGHPFERTILPVTLALALGARMLIVSNAAGGINPRFEVGDLMLIDDMMRVGFPVAPMTTSSYNRYSNASEINQALEIANSLGIRIRQGTYLYVKGPVYETKAEIRAYRAIGADAVGMSTMPELHEANRLGLKSIGISLITNLATGLSKHKLEHAEIKDVADARKDEFATLVRHLINNLTI